MKMIELPARDMWPALVTRPTQDARSLNELVEEVFTQVQARGDEALRKYTSLFDGQEVMQWKVDRTDIEAAYGQIDSELLTALETAKANITAFHRQPQASNAPVETSPGVVCWWESRPIQNVGLYVPGGSAPLFSTVLMLGIPAQIAGCERVIMCTPPDKDGSVNPAILVAADMVGITEIYTVGGIQAIAALSLGTETIPQVSKIFGPGNQYVTAAKQYAAGSGVAIDMPAGPSELLVIADDSADPDFVASDLISQAEHGPDSQVIMLSSSEDLIEKTIEAVQSQLAELPRAKIAQEALSSSRFVLLSNDLDMIDFSNLYAPEHLIINTKNARELAFQVRNAGSVFIGQYTPESAGDYASGTNHTLPTNGASRSYSGVSTDSFRKRVTFQEISPEGLQQLGSTIEVMAEKEELLGHKNAVSIRLKALS